MKNKSALVIPIISIVLLIISPIFLYFCGINYIFICFIIIYEFLIIKNLILSQNEKSLKKIARGEIGLLFFNVVILVILYFFENINITAAFLYSNVPILIMFEFLLLYSTEKLEKHSLKLYILFLIFYLLLYNFYYLLFINCNPLGLSSLIKYTFKIISLYIPFIPIKYAIIKNKKIQMHFGFFMGKLIFVLIGYYFWNLRGLLFSIPLYEILLLIYTSLKSKKIKE